MGGQETLHDRHKKPQAGQEKPQDNHRIRLRLNRQPCDGQKKVQGGQKKPQTRNKKLQVYQNHKDDQKQPEAEQKKPQVGSDTWDDL